MKQIFPLILAIFVFSVSHSFAQQEEKPALPENKAYVVYTEGSRSNFYVIEDMEKAEYFSGIKCIKGRMSDANGLKNTSVYIPVDKIISIVEYDSIMAYKEQIKKMRDSKKGGKIE